MGGLYGCHDRSEGKPEDVAHLDCFGGRHASDGPVYRGRDFFDFAAMVAGWTLSGVSFGSRRGAGPDLAALAQRGRGAAGFEPGERGVELRMVARWDTVRMPDADGSAGEQIERCAALHAHLFQVQR